MTQTHVKVRLTSRHGTLAVNDEFILLEITKKFKELIHSLVYSDIKFLCNVITQCAKRVTIATHQPHIVNIHEKINILFLTQTEIYARIRRLFLEAKFRETSVELLMPYPSCLLQPVLGIAELEAVPRLVIQVHAVKNL